MRREQVVLSSPSPSVMLTLTPLLLGLILFTITIWTILGNVFVILAFIIDKHIRQGGLANYFIINLALSDLLLGVVVLPFSASYSTFGIWHFGHVFCEVWLMIDVLCSTASIWVDLSTTSSPSRLRVSLESPNDRVRSLRSDELSHSIPFSSSVDLARVNSHLYRLVRVHRDLSSSRVVLQQPESTGDNRR